MFSPEEMVEAEAEPRGGISRDPAEEETTTTTLSSSSNNSSRLSSSNSSISLSPIAASVKVEKVSCMFDILQLNLNLISESNSVQTQCPAGTKCVSDFFCDENAVMVNYRVDLTPAQKQRRGNLLVRKKTQNYQSDK